MSFIMETLGFGAMLSSLASGFRMVKGCFRPKKKDKTVNINSNNEYEISNNDIHIRNKTIYNNGCHQNNKNYDSL